jgi:hypothetical protein
MVIDRRRVSWLRLPLTHVCVRVNALADVALSRRRGSRGGSAHAAVPSATVCDVDVSILRGVGPRACGTRAAVLASMNNLLRGGIAGVSAWWLGGGLISTLIIFALAYWFLGHFH